MVDVIALPSTPLLTQSVSIDTADYGLLIAAHRAISGLEHALQFSLPIASISFCDTVRLIDGLGAVQLDGEPVWMQSVIEEPGSDAVQRAVTYASIASSLAYSLRSTNITQSVALQIASKLSGESAGGDVLRRDANSSEVFQHGLAHWEHFVSDTSGDQDSLILSAIADAKFRRLCPFQANNNATAGLLLGAVLRNEQVLHHAPLCLSNYLSRHSEQFAQALSDDGAVVRFYLTAYSELANELLACLARLVAHINHCHEVVSETLSRAPVDTVMRVICRPICTNNDLIEAGITRRQTSASYLKKLAEAGLLESRRQGKELRYTNNGVINAFKSFI